MCSHSETGKATGAEERYFTETALVLRREGFQVEEILDDQIVVWLDDQPLCEISKIGGITYRGEDIATPAREAAKDKVYGIVSTTAEYMQLMEQAPPLEVNDLKDRYKALVDFNGTVLAGAYGKHGVEFVTWDWDFDRRGVSHGHYFGENYAGAKQDFATRSGLIPEQRIFDDEQLAEIYRCAKETMDMDYPISGKRLRLLEEVCGQIESTVPDLEERVERSMDLDGIGEAQFEQALY